MLPKFYEESETDIITMTTSNGLVRRQKNLKNLIEGARKRGVQHRVITNVNRENMKYALEMNAEIRHVDDVHAITTCYDDKRLLMIELKNDKPDLKSQDDAMLITTNPETIKMTRQMMEGVWKDAMPLEERIAQLRAEEEKHIDELARLEEKDVKDYQS